MIMKYLGITAMNLDNIISPYYFATIGKLTPFRIRLQVDSVTLEWYGNTKDTNKLTINTTSSNKLWQETITLHQICSNTKLACWYIKTQEC